MASSETIPAAQPVHLHAEELLPAMNPDETAGYTYQRVDGTIETATSKEEVFANCPVLGKLALESPETAALLLELSASGNQIKAEDRASSPDIPPIIAKSNSTTDKKSPAHILKASESLLTRPTPALPVLEKPDPRTPIEHMQAVEVASRLKLLNEIPVLSEVKDTALKTGDKLGTETNKEVDPPISSTLTVELKQARKKENDEIISRSHQDANAKLGITLPVESIDEAATIRKSSEHIQPKDLHTSGASHENNDFLPDHDAVYEKKLPAEKGQPPAIAEPPVESGPSIVSSSEVGRVLAREHISVSEHEADFTPPIDDVEQTADFPDQQSIDIYYDLIGLSPEPLTSDTETNIYSEILDTEETSQSFDSDESHQERIESFIDSILGNSEVETGESSSRADTLALEATLGRFVKTLKNDRDGAERTAVEETVVPAFKELLLLIEESTLKNDGKPQLTPKIVEKMSGILYALGSQNPHQELIEFVQTYDIHYLMYMFSYLGKNNFNIWHEDLVGTASASSATISASKVNVAKQIIKLLVNPLNRQLLTN